MKKVKIGSFKTNGELIVIDPCYERDSRSAVLIDVKPGLYNAYVVVGSLKEPLFVWDEVEGNFRVAELIIEHESADSNLTMKKHTKSIGVDSGQAGFFNKEVFGKDLPEEIPLYGKREYFHREHITSSRFQIHCAKESLKLQEKDETFARMMTLEHFIEDKSKTVKEHTIEYFKNSILRDERSIERSQKVLETKEFYEVVMSKTSEEFGGGVVDNVGAVSKTGIGDGGYEVFVAKDKRGNIVAAKIEFFNKSEWVKGTPVML